MPPLVVMAVDDAAIVEATDDHATGVTHMEEMTTEDAVNLPLNQRLPIAIRYFQIDLRDGHIGEREGTL
jgi:hypothetical protein